MLRNCWLLFNKPISSVFVYIHLTTRLIAPLFENPEDSTDLYFVVDGECDSNEADGGGEEVELLEQHLKTEYATLEKQDENLGERDRLYQMGFTDNDFRIVVQFKQRKLGE